jgi:hypothetical protein
MNDLFLAGQNWFLSKEIWVTGTRQTNEQQRHFKEWPISEWRGEVDFIQNSSKLHFTLQQ